MKTHIISLQGSIIRGVVHNNPEKLILNDEILAEPESINVSKNDLLKPVVSCKNNRDMSFYILCTEDQIEQAKSILIAKIQEETVSWCRHYERISETLHSFSP